MGVTIINKLPQFSKSAESVLDDALREGAKDIYIKAKIRAPYSGDKKVTGNIKKREDHLINNSDHERHSKLKYRVHFDAVYARFQEFGGDGKRKVRKYTTAGTGAHYLQKSGDEIAKKINNTFKKHAGRARVW